MQQVMIDPCNRKDCNNPKRGTQFCAEHECTYNGCNAAPKKDQTLCGPHYDMAEREYAKMAEEQQRQTELKAVGGVDISKALEERMTTTMHSNSIEIDDLPIHNEKGEPIYYVSFSGHRPTKIGGYELGYDGKPNPKLNKEFNQAVYDAIENALQRAVDKFVGREVRVISGGALGVDQMAARVARNMGLKYYVFVPCLGHESRWSGHEKARYNTMLSLSEGVVYVTKEKYNYKCMQLRNEAMVDKSHATVFVWNGSEGGTFNCLKYAHQVGQPKVMIFVNETGVVTNDNGTAAFRVHMQSMLNE